MSIIAAFVMATFTTPEQIGATPQSMLWLLPLVAAIAIVYKATKLPEIKVANFLKEVVILFSSIVVVLSIIALVLCTFVWVIIE